ncbi:hypothetical protein [Streptomyces sp. NPDC007856]|uniref:hypothetical protein n=1 Tax=Streptomyces sp. NPDC007856 TaxID=3364781 RepID=UPI0036B5395F
MTAFGEMLAGHPFAADRPGTTHVMTVEYARALDAYDKATGEAARNPALARRELDEGLAVLNRVNARLVGAPPTESTAGAEPRERAAQARTAPAITRPKKGAPERAGDDGEAPRTPAVGAAKPRLRDRYAPEQLLLRAALTVLAVYCLLVGFLAGWVQAFGCLVATNLGGHEPDDDGAAGGHRVRLGGGRLGGGAPLPHGRVRRTGGRRGCCPRVGFAHPRGRGALGLAGGGFVLCTAAWESRRALRGGRVLARYSRTERAFSTSTPWEQHYVHVDADGRELTYRRGVPSGSFAPLPSRRLWLVAGRNPGLITSTQLFLAPLLVLAGAPRPLFLGGLRSPWRSSPAR